MKPYRREKLASLIHEVVADAFLHRLNDPRVSPMTTVTRVEMIGDMSVAKVFLIVHGGGAVERRTLAAVQNARGFVQRLLAQVLTMRQCPELRFEIDEQAKIAQRTLDILAENRRLNPELCEPVMDESESESVGVPDDHVSDIAQGDQPDDDDQEADIE